MFQVTAQIINHLFAQNSWAFRYLKPYAGKTVSIQLLPMTWVWSIQDDGSVLNVDNIAQVDATCQLTPLQLPRLMARDASLANELSIQGDAGLAEVLRSILLNLKWDVAEDLSRVTGDIAAERIVSTIQNLPKPPLPNFVSQVASGVPTPKLMVKQSEFDQHSQQVVQLAAEIEQLNQRMARLTESSKS